MESSFRPMTCKNKWDLKDFGLGQATLLLPNVGASSVKEKPFTLRTLGDAAG